AHAGFGCLIDCSRIKNNQPSRKHESVVDAILRHFDNTERLEIIIACGISAKYFSYSAEDTKYGEGNEKLLSYLLNAYGTNVVSHGKKQGSISLRALIKHQFQSHGIDPEIIKSDYIDTYEDCDSSGNQKWWAHVRYAQGKQEVDGRNGIFIVHK